MASKRRNVFYQNKKQETTEIVMGDRSRFRFQPGRSDLGDMRRGQHPEDMRTADTYKRWRKRGRGEADGLRGTERSVTQSWSGCPAEGAARPCPPAVGIIS
ncbi:hypothetical protein AAG570_008909 [Ranatra chinensis]|uniref:Uncharacterized protein n=1 Tax=Ranatra chinensis TaxID=642074 RepID=A0ABD0Z553_9HEMI